MRKRLSILVNTLLIAITTVTAGCGGRKSGSADVPATVPHVAAADIKFNADSAYNYVKRQTEFGPRVPGSAAHSATAAYLADFMRRMNPDTVTVQTAPVKFADGKTAELKNIFARWGADRKSHVLLLAHWDTRPWADEDPDTKNHNTPIDGANDGGSGTGVLMEIARQLSRQLPPETGVDILLVDAEDSGIDGDDASWCLGAQYFADNLPYKPTEMPRYAILLDMVGGRDARFHREYLSDHFARNIVDKVWSTASSIGYGHRFPNETGGALTDDHIALNRAGIPAIDIVENRHPVTGTFNPTWHTLDDNISNIDRGTLETVGRTVMKVLQNEK